MPVTAVNLLRVILLLVVIGLVSDIDNLIQKTSTELAMIGSFLSRLVCGHLSTSHDALLYDSLGCLLHGFHHFLFFTFCKLLVQVSAPLVLALAQLAVLTDDFFALVGAPDFIVKLFLLITLVFDQLNDHVLALLELQLFHIFLLLAD